ncbi:Oxygen-independent coproporphyrinogen-III oxidase-like protein YqeR [Aquicella siphonis]|uniref:Heme chaperone HemW n=1 Tax=Aquicella siphonis TaxID=254247 RepID=A0A5E4PK36_9COXI|nr:radical SAM family heme chaperone HemW [Aquicella siphonis]VVC76733.1 Oxygen-independent coproporphyrinogen-III oxidase-like protein YqeR [Aquicella siphonis]
MLIFSRPLPLSLYIHIPWCVRKCPYCDFNSHQAQSSLPEDLYVAALLQELDSRLPLIQNRPLKSIFFGGGTPSLFSAQAIGGILEGVAKRIAVSGNLEVTLEANPGTIDQPRFRGFRAAGINRLSLGIQSLQDEKLRILGRIHDRASAIQAVARAKEAGFRHFNLDIMYGLPDQSLEDARQDIQTALDLAPTHFSWYQLTLEPNTAFYRQPPPLPSDDAAWEMQLAGQQILSEAGFRQYEVSAYSLPRQECAHNRNYWEFGDYLGIGAGAHSKITDHESGIIRRFSQVRHPKDYLDARKRLNLNTSELREPDIIFEFMLNALRLTQGVPADLFTRHTGLPLQRIEPLLTAARQRELLIEDTENLCPTELGKKFLNNLTEMFLTAS